MNINLLRQDLALYLQQLSNRWNRGEKKKWYRVKQFQETFDINAPDLPAMLRNAINSTSMAGRTSPRNMLISFASDYPNEVRAEISNLFDNNQTIDARIQHYVSRFHELWDLANRNLHRDYPSSGQSTNSTSELLALKYPDSYCDYRLNLAKNASNRYELDISISKNDDDKVAKAVQITTLVRDALAAENDFVSAIRSLIDSDNRCYSDVRLLLAAADFMYFVKSEIVDKNSPANGNDTEEELEESDDDSGDFDSEESPLLDFKNLIIYGIPGCGKSYKLEHEYLASFDCDRVVRTTFHPEYSNTDFVGQVRPAKRNATISYDVVPGPFSRAILLAMKSPDKKVALVIEEINRGNAAAIFGDLFQLLDRDSSGNSEYEIVNETISSYLMDNGIDVEKIKIPSNMYLYATMNTSDQNVFKLDTAFKRRWEFERMTNKDTLDQVQDFTVFTLGGNDVSWLKFIEKINFVISCNDDISGDRQIGNFFYTANGIDLKRFANKVLEYLYNDVCKYGGKEEIFNVEKYKTFDDIYDAFVDGKNVFANSLFAFSDMETPAIEEQQHDEDGQE